MDVNVDGPTLLSLGLTDLPSFDDETDSSYLPPTTGSKPTTSLGGFSSAFSTSSVIFGDPRHGSGRQFGVPDARDNNDGGVVSNEGTIGAGASGGLKGLDPSVAEFRYAEQNAAGSSALASGGAGTNGKAKGVDSGDGRLGTARVLDPLAGPWAALPASSSAPGSVTPSGGPGYSYPGNDHA